MASIDFFSDATRERMRVPLVDTCARLVKERSQPSKIYALCLAWRTSGTEVATGFELYLAEDPIRRSSDGSYLDDPYEVWNPMEWPFEPIDAYSDVLPLLDDDVRSMLEQIDAALEAQIEAIEPDDEPLTIDVSVGYQIMLLLREVASELGNRDLGFERTDDFVAYALHLDRRDFDEVPEQASPAALSLLRERGLI